MRKFVRFFGVSSSTSVLDLGGSPFIWELAGVRPARLTILNLSTADFPPGTWFEAVTGDACEVSFPDKCFDVVFSNSVIEHLGARERQRQFAAECMRCGRGFFVQTPNKWFPIDTHTLMPVAHWFPRLFRRLIRFSPRALISKMTEMDVADLRGLRLLGKSEMQELFPGAMIVEEKFLGLTKSLIAVYVAPCLSPTDSGVNQAHSRTP